MLEINKIYNEDCLEGMKKIDDKSIDFIFTDLPFSTTQNSWDVLIPFEPLWKQYERIIKANGCISGNCLISFTTTSGSMKSNAVSTTKCCRA